MKIFSDLINNLTRVPLTIDYSLVSIRRGGQNKRKDWQISAKIINGEVGKNLQS